MVEFGLKLEDNKVGKWANEYIDYEKLKAVLKRAKACAEYRDSIQSRASKQVVEAVLKERKWRLESAETESPKSPKRDSPLGKNPKGWVRKTDENHGPKPPSLEVTLRDNSNATNATEVTEATPLMSADCPRSKTQLGRVDSWGSIHGAVRKVSSYLGLADEKSLLLQAYDDSDEKLKLFQKQYEKELCKVQDFIDRNSADEAHRMEALLETVDATGFNKKRKDDRERMLQRKSQSVLGSITERLETLMFKQAPHSESIDQSKRSTSSIPHLEYSVSMDFDDQENVLGDLMGNRTYSGATAENDQERLDLVRKSDSIRRAITDNYRTAKLLHNYCIMNYTGFIKIAKKFDKTFPTHKGMFKGKNCDDGRQAELLASRMEKIYAKWFCDGNVKEAQAQLLSKRGDGLMMDWTQLRLGYRLGMCSILALWVAWDCVWGQLALNEVSIGGRTAFPVFRGVFGLLSWHWFWGFAVYVWNRFRINYIYLFEFDPRNISSAIEIFNDAVDETLVFLSLMLLYYKADAGDMPLWIAPRVYPLILVGYALRCLFSPWKTRKHLWKTIREAIAAPLIQPTFFHVYVGDVFTSMVKVFQDLLWTGCWLVSGDFLVATHSKHQHGHDVHVWTSTFWYKSVAIPLVCCFPLFVRFNQCLRKYMDTRKAMPNLANALKYAMSQCVTLFGAFHPLYLMHNRRDQYNITMNDEETLVISDQSKFDFFQVFWMGLFISSSLYSYWWDVFMDWGLGRRNYGGLGPRLMFPRKSYYYAVMAADLVLRFMWVLTLLPPQSGAKFELPAYLSAISMVVELFRRTIWSFFRLENEHRQNTNGYRRVNVVPLHFNTDHKRNYNERRWVGWKVLVEIAIVSAVVIGISALSVIVAQRASQRAQLSQPSPDL